MKIRNGFVSNSSSSSFTCNVCTATAEGMDICVTDSEWNWRICKNGHTLCDVCWIPSANAIRPIRDEFETREEYEKAYKQWQNETESGYAASTECCPICQFTEICNKDLVRLWTKDYKIPVDEVLQEIKKVNARRKVVKPEEYMAYVIKKENLKSEDILPNLRSRFGTYEALKQYIVK